MTLAKGGGRARTKSVATTLLVVAISGCLALPSSNAPCSLSILPARGGESYGYAAEGTARFEFTKAGVVVDWRIVDPSAEGQSRLDLPSGSKVMVEVGERPARRLTQSGEGRTMHQISYWAHHPAYPKPLPFLDEWLDGDTGSLTQSNSRATLLLGDEIRHQQMLTRIDRPPLLFAPLFWDRELVTGVSGEIQFPKGFGAPDSWKQGRNGTLRYDVAATYEDDGVCHADVRLEFRRQLSQATPEYRFVYELKLRSDVPLPVEYAEVYDPNLDFEIDDLRMNLVSRTDGSGSMLPVFRSVGTPPDGLALRPMQGGFLEDHPGLFPTDYLEALAAIRMDVSARAWLDAHPDARPGFVQHSLGEAGGTILDRWSLTWIDPEGAEVATIATKRLVHTDLPLDELEVRTRPSNEGYGYPNRSQVISMTTIADVHQAMYGRAVEVLQCEMARESCFVGTHNGTHFPYACEGGCGGLHIAPGIVLWITKGWILQEVSYDSTSLGPAVGVP